MSKTPFMQLYPGDYLSDTLHLTTEQHGAYLLLLMAMWRSGAKLPNDPAILSRICGFSPKRWAKEWSVVSGFFMIEEGSITNPRLTKEYQKAVSRSEERKAAGSRGGTSNALKNNTTREAIAKAELEHSQISQPDKREEAKASPLPVVDENALAVAIYNNAAGRAGWSQVQRMNKARASALNARIKEAGGLEGWRHAIMRAETSDFLCGRKPGRDGAFFASFDFITQTRIFTRLMEGSYDNRDPQLRATGPGLQQNRADPALEQISRLAGLGQA